MRSAASANPYGSGRPVPRARALLAAGDTETLNHYRNVLEALGLRVKTCTTYAAVAALLDREDFALAFVSEEGGDFEAWQVLKRVLGARPAIPTVVVTRQFSLEASRKAIELGAADYLEEPVTVRQFVCLIKAHLNQNALQSVARGRRSARPAIAPA